MPFDDDSEEEEEVEEEEEMKEEVEETGESEKIKVITKFGMIFIFIGLILFMSIILITSGILEKSVPGISSSCMETIQKPALYAFPTKIYAKATAESTLRFYINENVTFISEYLDACGISYRFNSSTKNYAVCESGEIYNYGLVCKKTSLWTSIIDMLKGLFRVK